ncbi:9041_t:CDS:2 [Ambispora leptoticha]|uniref:9041_t:CDS:1 n=1 Tax=Ambispora leptoticha TaxID=144679 RepID=A0A9N9CAP1_9GLOM|nr:9041_t:CDS:2 [Ambispora leptoticha]
MMQLQFKGWETALDPENFTLLSILKFRQTRDDFSFNKSVEHTLISKFVSYVAETADKKWGKVASALNNDGGIFKQAQWEDVKLFWNKIEFEKAEINTQLLRYLQTKQQLQATKNASNQINVIQNRFINKSKKREHDLQVDKETSKKHQTRSGRVTIPDYNEETDEASSSDVSIPELSSQENKPETMYATIEKGLDINSQENSKKKIIRDDVITDILGNTIDYSDATKDIFSIYKEQYPDGDLIDLRLNSPFLKKLPEPTARSYLMEMDTVTESLVPKIVHDFLVKFFSKNLSAKEWHCEIDDLKSPEPNDPVMTAVVRAIRSTLPQFIKAFSLEDQNPLLNISTIEGVYLNSFVHPCFDAFLWYIANVNYEYGEITSKSHVNRNRADGAGFMADADKYQLVYMEGSRPVARDDKEINDLEKITSNSKKMFAEIVKGIVKNRRRLPSTLRVFGGQSFRRRIHLFYIDYRGTYRLNEVDNANLPRKFSEMKDFIYFYECVLKWALLVRNVTESFDLARTEPRPSRLSFANALFQLDE